MRFCLSQLHVWHPPEEYPSWNLLKRTPHDNNSTTQTNTSGEFPEEVKATNGHKHGIRGHLYEVYHQMREKVTPTGTRDRTTTKSSATEMTVTGQYIQHSSRPSQKVLFWIYGGAFLAGDSKGNLGIAEKMGMVCGVESADTEGNVVDMRDVFIPDYRLVPEYHLDDAIHDVTLAYEYLIFERGVRPEDVVLLGISSGGGLVALLLQALEAAQRMFDQMGEENRTYASIPAGLPSGGVLMSPFVDYTEPFGSMREYTKHDLIVHQVSSCLT
jgi:acetyl esterase/lipase